MHVVQQQAANRIHYATLPRQNSVPQQQQQQQPPHQGQQQKFAYPMDGTMKPSMERGVPEGEAAAAPPMSDNMPPPNCQDGEMINNNGAVPGTVYYAMNVWQGQ